MRFDNVKHYKPEEFRRLTGVKLATFNKMVEIVTQALKEKKAKGGRPNKLSPPDMVLMTLEYLREYRTYFHISSSYGISESNSYYTIRFVEDTLIKSKCFSLPDRKQLLKSDMEYEVVVINATETPIQRPKKKQKQFYSGKKKRHTLKTQLIVDKKTTEIICTSYKNGKYHDYRLFKESGIKIQSKVKIAVNTGYQGLQKIHEQTLLPKKKSKKNPLFDCIPNVSSPLSSC